MPRPRNPFSYRTDEHRFQLAQMRVSREAERAKELDDIEREISPLHRRVNLFADPRQMLTEISGRLGAEGRFPSPAERAEIDRLTAIIEGSPGAPHGEPPFPGIVGKVPGFRTPAELAATLGTGGLGSASALVKAGALIGGTGGAFGGGEAGERIAGSRGRMAGELIGGLGGAFGGGLAAPGVSRVARRAVGEAATDIRLAPERGGPVSRNIPPEGGGIGESMMRGVRRYEASEGGAVPPRPPVEPPAAPEPVDPVQKFTDWMEESSATFAKSRKERQANVASLRSKQAGALKSVYGREGLTPQQQVEEGLRSLRGTAGETPLGPPPITETETGDILSRIRDFPIWQNRPFKALNAQTGFLKMMNGELPGQYELGLLEQVFGPKFVRAAARSSGSKWRELAAAWGLPRTVRTIIDVSWPLRQGIGVLPRHPKEVIGNIPKGVRAVFDGKMAQQWDEATRLKSATKEIIGDDGVAKTWTIGELQDEVDLFLPGIDQEVAPLAERTEEFMATQGSDTWVGRIFGPVARPFGRSFVTMGNATRSDIFENVVTSPFWKGATMEDARGLAWLLNVATGRGDLGALNRYGALLANPIFSPRLIAGRIEHALSPAILAKGVGGAPRSMKAANLAAQQLTTFIGSGLALLTVASQVPGLKVEWNPLSSKWGKIEIGYDPNNPLKDTTKIDLFGGYQQYARFIAQLYKAKAKNDQGFIKDRDRWDLAKQFVRNKAAPNLGTIWDVLAGEYGTGEKLDLKTAAGVRTFLWNEYSPLSVNDIVESVNRDDGIRPEYGVLAPLSTFGSGVQTYGGRPQSVIFSMPKYEGIPFEGEQELEDYIKEVDYEWNRAQKAGAGLSKTQIALILGQETGREGLGKVASQAISGDLPLNKERIQFAIDHQDELEPKTLLQIVPDPILRDYLSEENFERVFKR